MAEHWLSIVEYARTFGISDMTIRRRIRTGRIQAYLRDGKYYIPIDMDPVTGDPIKQSSKAKAQNQVSSNSAMKSHPAGERTIPQVRAQAPVETRPAAPRLEPKPEPRTEFPRVDARMESRVQSYAPQYGQIPGRIAASIAAESAISVEAQALLEYCNSSLATVKDIEKHVENHYSAKIETAMEQLKNRDMEIGKLNQQIEDLQLLVQILERRRV